MNNTDLLRPLIVQGLLDTEIPKDNCDFKTWIASGQYMVRDVPNAKELSIEINNNHAFNHMLAHDSCRMATAAFETMENIYVSHKLPKSYGWIAVKSYYAAFFSAHSIMRCFGFTCSQLERGHVKILNDYSSALGITNSVRVERGFFTGAYDVTNRMFSLKKMGNTHEDTWRCFTDCLKSLSTDVLSVNGLTTKKQMLSAEIDDLETILTASGRLPKGNYLSEFRNSINYRQEHFSWYPYGKGAIKSEKIMALLGNWKLDTMPIIPGWKESNDAYNFFYCCVEIVNLCRKMIELIIENSASTNNLYERWPNKFLKLTASA